MIRVRRAELADVEAVREVGVKTWPVAYAGIASPEFIADGIAQWWSPEMVERGIRNGITLVAVEDSAGRPDEGVGAGRDGQRADPERIVGMVGVGREAEHWVMWKLYVLPEHQGEGVGTLLLNAAIAALPSDATQLMLDVMVDNEQAIGFYRKHGFREARSTPDRDLGVELMWMSRDL